VARKEENYLCSSVELILLFFLLQAFVSNKRKAKSRIQQKRIAVELAGINTIDFFAFIDMCAQKK
jgi:hypothetical protein